MVTPNAEWLEVVRLNHNLGKIHDVAVPALSCVTSPPMAKRLCAPSAWTSPAAPSARKAWQDVTDKFPGRLARHPERRL